MPQMPIKSAFQNQKFLTKLATAEALKAYSRDILVNLKFKVYTPLIADSSCCQGVYILEEETFFKNVVIQLMGDK